MPVTRVSQNYIWSLILAMCVTSPYNLRDLQHNEGLDIKILTGIEEGNVKERTQTLQSVSGLDLHLRIWEPEGSSIREGSVILSHGLGEHCGRYTHVAQHFTDRGFSVYGADHVGFGRSGGRRGHAPDGVNTYTADLRSVAQLASEETAEDAQQIFLGHSMGGLFVLLIMLDHPGEITEAIVNGPAIDSGRNASPTRITIARVLNRIVPFMTKDHGYPARYVCSDPEVVAEYKADPLVHRRISFRLIVSILNAGARVRAQPEDFDPETSLLLLNGAEDKIAPPDATRTFGEHIVCEDKQIVILDGMRHEVFNEEDRHKTFQAVDRFFEL